MPTEVYTTSKKMVDSDLHLLGLLEAYACLEWMILTILPIPLLPVQPSIAVDGSAMRSEDDLAHRLGDIIKASVNICWCENEGALSHVITELKQLLQVIYLPYLLEWILQTSYSSMSQLIWIMTLLEFHKLFKSQVVQSRRFMLSWRAKRVIFVVTWCASEWIFQLVQLLLVIPIWSLMKLEFPRQSLWNWHILNEVGQ